MTDTAALVASISTMAKAAYTAQFIPWVPHELLALDVPLNQSFRRLLQLPPSHPNALLYLGAPEGGLGLPRLSDRINLRKWSMIGRLRELGGLSSLAIGGFLSRASEVSGGQFLEPIRAILSVPTPLRRSGDAALARCARTPPSVSPLRWVHTHIRSSSP